MRRHIVTLTVTVTLIVGAFVATLLSDNRPELGLDLQGGISVVLFPVEGSDLSALDTATDIIRNRVDALGVVEPEVIRQGDTIVIDLPGAKDRDEALAVVGRTAELRFRPVMDYLPPEGAAVTPDVPGDTPEETAPGATTTTPGAATTTPATTTETTAPPEPETTAGDGATGAPRTVSTANVASVRPAQETPTTTTPPTTAPVPGETVPAGEVPGGEAPGGEVPPSTVAPDATCEDVLTSREDDVADQVVWLPELPEGDEPVGCFMLGPAVLTGKSVQSAGSSYQSGAGYTVDLTFKGDDFVEKVAVPYVGREVAIVLDGVVYSAPTINEGITGREVQITGSFTGGEAEDLALVLRYGSLPVQFDEAEQTVQSISPSLGKDQLRAGVIAGIIGIALVALYMVLYYRLLGLVVWFGVGLTALIFFSLVSLLSAGLGLTLTLAGVTGVIVSVGVTVDSYVVYFERLKDEVRTGKTVRSSIDVGFRRSFRTIVAADLVSLLGATVLYLLATGSVRGFAFFLAISTIIDLFISYFVMWPTVALIARQPRLVRLPGVGIAAGLDVREARA